MKNKFDYLLDKKEILENYSSYSDIKRNLFNLKVAMNEIKAKTNSCYYLNKSKEEEQKNLKPFIKTFHKDLKRSFSEKDIKLLAEKISLIPGNTKTAILNIASIIDDGKNHYAVINILCDLYNSNVLRHDHLSSFSYLKKSGRKIEVWQKLSKEDKSFKLLFISDFLNFHGDDTGFIKNLNKEMTKDIDVLFKETKLFNVYIESNKEKMLKERKDKNYLNMLEEISKRFQNNK